MFETIGAACGIASLLIWGIRHFIFGSTDDQILDRTDRLWNRVQAAEKYHKIEYHGYHYGYYKPITPTKMKKNARR